jgi:hypothetical protein
MHEYEVECYAFKMRINTVFISGIYVFLLLRLSIFFENIVRGIDR